MTQIILCCSFAPLSIDYDYSGLSSFNDLADSCIFFNSGIDANTISVINNQFTIPISWYKYSFVDFCTMRNDLIKKARKIPNSFIWMIDDSYCINCPYTKNQLNELIRDRNCLECKFRCHTYEDNVIKLFRADSFHYILQVHEILVPINTFNKVITDIQILDIPDYTRSQSRALRDIKWMESDLINYNGDIFIMAHLCIYLADAYYTIGNKSKSINYYQKVIELDGPYLKRARRALNSYLQDSF